jgi:hypothetical protein
MPGAMKVALDEADRVELGLEISFNHETRTAMFRQACRACG